MVRTLILTSTIGFMSSSCYIKLMIALLVGGACLGPRARGEVHRARAMGASGVAALLSVLGLMSTAFWLGGSDAYVLCRLYGSAFRS